MGTEVQFKMFVPGYQFTNDVNDKARNGSLLLGYSNDALQNGNRNTEISRWTKPDLHHGCEKESLKHIILMQESVFRHQLNELHRLYKIQRDIMDEIKCKDQRASTTAYASSFFSSGEKYPQHIHNLPMGLPSSRNIPSSKETGITSNVRRLYDLELPAEECSIEEQRFTPCSISNLATEGLSSSISADVAGRYRGRVPWTNHSSSLRARLPQRVKTVQPSRGGSFIGQNLHGEIRSMSVLSDHQSTEMHTRRKLFGVEISGGNAYAGSRMRPNKPIESPRTIKGGLLIRGPGEGGSSYQMSTDSLLINFHQFVGTNKTNPSIPHSLIQDSSSATGTTNSGKRKVEVNGCLGNEKTLESYVDNFYSAERVGANVTDHSISPECAASDKQVIDKNMNLNSRKVFDLNVCPTEEDVCSTLCSETYPVKRTKGHTDSEVLVHEANGTLEEESAGSKQGSSVMLAVKLGEESDGLLRVAAETLVNISSSFANGHIEPNLPDKSKQIQIEILQWFAETITSSLADIPETDTFDQGTQIPEGMDYFEFATLNLVETEVEELPDKPPVLEEPQGRVSVGRPPNGHRRRCRQKRDFQRDVLPGLTSLSRNEVSEDLQMIEGLIKARTGISGTIPSHKNGGSKRRGRTKKRNSLGGNDHMLDDSPVVDKPGCHERGVEEGALMGWGRRLRRPKRTRCSAAIHSEQPKEVF